MPPTVDPNYGSFQLTSVADLPNCTVAFPGEHWSDGKAGEVITPGSLVIPSASAGKKIWGLASAGTLDPRASIALKCVQIPDSRGGSIYGDQLGPNVLVNRPIVVGEYVHAYRSLAAQLTLFTPSSAYVPGDLLTWDPTGARPTGKTGTGSWKRGGTAANSFFEVEEFRPLASAPTEGVLTVKSLRSQF